MFLFVDIICYIDSTNIKFLAIIIDILKRFCDLFSYIIAHV